MEENEERTLYENLEYLNETKGIIKQAIIDKGVEISADTPFREYADKISDITTGEDLEAELSAQEQIIQEMKTALENKAAGGKVKLNIYAQTTEPTNKDGIWLNTNKTFDKVYFRDNVVQSGNYDTAYSGSTASINYAPGIYCENNDTFYAFGDDGLGYYPKSVFKLQVSSYGSTRLDNLVMPSSWGDNGLSSLLPMCIDDIIYLSTTYSPFYKLLKFDTTTDTFTSCISMPFACCDAAVVYENCIYYFGCGSGGSNLVYKYDPSNDSFTALPSLSRTHRYGMACVVGNDAYIFCPMNNKIILKYNLQTYTTTTMSAECPQIFSCQPVAVDNDIYLFYNNLTYKYSTIDDSFTQLTNCPITSYTTKTFPFLKDNYIYIDNNGKLYRYVLNYENFDTKSIIISQTNIGTNKRTVILRPTDTQIFNGELLQCFNNVYYYTTEGGLDDTIPTYYGDGTQWVKFKN